MQRVTPRNRCVRCKICHRGFCGGLGSICNKCRNKMRHNRRISRVRQVRREPNAIDKALFDEPPKPMKPPKPTPSWVGKAQKALINFMTKLGFRNQGDDCRIHKDC